MHYMKLKFRTVYLVTFCNMSPQGKNDVVDMNATIILFHAHDVVANKGVMTLTAFGEFESFVLKEEYGVNKSSFKPTIISNLISI